MRDTVDARRRGRAMLAAAGLALLAGAAPARAGTTERISVGLHGAQADGGSFLASISADGRFVAFLSDASNLVKGDTNSAPDCDPACGRDVFVRDRQTGKTERVSVSSSGAQADRDSGFDSPSISADGRFVAFASFATNLVPGDTNGNGCGTPPVCGLDVFVRDRKLGKTERVSLGVDGAQADGDSASPSISADGRFVAFTSQATNLVPGDTNGHQDIFVRDRKLGTTKRVSVSSEGKQADGDSGTYGLSISADGRFVAFTSQATNLASGDFSLGVLEVFVRDRARGTTEVVSVGPHGVVGNDQSDSPSISADGRFVAFDSRAGNLVQGDTGYIDVFVRDRLKGTTERVSVGPNGRQANDNSYGPSISAGGRFVAFVSLATNLVPGDTNGETNVFVRDRKAARTDLVSLTSRNGLSNGPSDGPSISAGGRFIAFTSGATNLVPGDTDEPGGVFVRRR